MEKRSFGKTGVEVSELCLGCMTFGATLDEKDSMSIIHSAIDEGITILDTANAYNAGRSEKIVGKALKGKRQDVFLATKVRHPEAEVGSFITQGLSRRHIMDCVEQSLRRLKTDYIDLYQVHWHDPKTPIEDTMRTLNLLVEQGKVRYIGCSNYYAWEIAKSNGIAELHHWVKFISVQPGYHLLWRKAEEELFPYCLAENLGVLSYSPLAGGLISGKYQDGKQPPKGTRGAANKQWYQQMMTPEAFQIIELLGEIGKAHGKTISQTAIAWVLTNPVVTTAIIGANSMKNFKENIGAAGYRLTPEEMKKLNRIDYCPNISRE